METETHTQARETTCAICLVEAPLFTSCGHPFCSSCLRLYVCKVFDEHPEFARQWHVLCPLCKQALLREEVQAAVEGEGPVEEGALSNFLAEEARKLPRPHSSPARGSWLRSYCWHVTTLTCIVAAYLYGLASDNYALWVAASLAAIPLLFLSPVRCDWPDGS